MSVNAAFCVVAIVLTVIMRNVLVRANKRLELGETTVAEEMRGHSHSQISGLTEEERMVYEEGFRYIA